MNFITTLISNLRETIQPLSEEAKPRIREYFDYVTIKSIFVERILHMIRVQFMEKGLQ
jgi:hypothetical protein